MTLRKGDVLVKTRGGKTKRGRALHVGSRSVTVEWLGTSQAQVGTTMLRLDEETGLPDGYVKEDS